jgi:hypothetical protein
VPPHSAKKPTVGSETTTQGTVRFTSFCGSARRRVGSPCAGGPSVNHSGNSKAYRGHLDEAPHFVAIGLPKVKHLP